MVVVRKIALGEATQLVKPFKDSLPPIGDLWSLVSQKWKELIRHASDILSSIGGKLKEIPFVTNIADFIEEGVNTCLPYVKKGMDYSVEKIEEGVNTCLPYVKKGMDYSVEKVKQHPYLFGFGLGLIVLILLCKCCCGGGGRGSRKTMKAPGRENRIFRDDFEANPKSYFRNLRGKGAYVRLE